MIMETDESKIYRVGQQAGDPEKLILQFQSKGLSAGEFLLT